MIDLSSSLKRIAWAYGCAKKDSAEEHALMDLLLRKVFAHLGKVSRGMKAGTVVREMEQLLNPEEKKT